ncbi:MAG: hypothetical protein WBB01_10150, partial [Phormidesmis sp.]
VYTWSVDIDEQDLSTGGFHAARIQGDVYKTLICHNFLGNASATLIRKDCLVQIGGYSTQLKAQNAQGCEDWDLYLRLAERYDFGVVPEFLVGYRKVSGSMSGDFGQMARSQRAMLQAIEQKHSELPGYLYRLSCSSFYLYLAQRSNLCNAPESTLFWLRQAITVDPITPLCRPGFYLLLIKNLARKFVGTATAAQAEAKPAILNSSKYPTSAASSGAVSIPPLEINRLTIWLKLLVGSVFHLLLSRI